MPLTITGNRQLQIQVRICALSNSNDPSKAIQKFEAFGLSDQAPAAGVSGPSGGVIPTSTTSSSAHTFPAAGTYVVTPTTTDGRLRAATITRSITVSAA